MFSRPTVVSLSLVFKTRVFFDAVAILDKDLSRPFEELQSIAKHVDANLTCLCLCPGDDLTNHQD